MIVLPTNVNFISECEMTWNGSTTDMNIIAFACLEHNWVIEKSVVEIHRKIIFLSRRLSFLSLDSLLSFPPFFLCNEIDWRKHEQIIVILMSIKRKKIILLSSRITLKLILEMKTVFSVIVRFEWRVDSREANINGKLNCAFWQQQKSRKFAT